MELELSVRRSSLARGPGGPRASSAVRRRRARRHRRDLVDAARAITRRGDGEPGEVAAGAQRAQAGGPAGGRGVRGGPGGHPRSAVDHRRSVPRAGVRPSAPRASSRERPRAGPLLGQGASSWASEVRPGPLRGWASPRPTGLDLQPQRGLGAVGEGGGPGGDLVEVLGREGSPPSASWDAPSETCVVPSASGVALSAAKGWTWRSVEPAVHVLQVALGRLVSQRVGCRSRDLLADVGDGRAGGRVADQRDLPLTGLSVPEERIAWEKSEGIVSTA